VAPHDLERQFDEHARAFREMIAFLRNIVRDDGKLRNGLVEAEQFNPDLFQAFSQRLVNEAGQLLGEVRGVAASALSAAAEAKAALEEIKAREETSANNVGRSLAALHVVRERLNAMQESPAPQVVTPALPTGVLGHDAGGFYGVDTGAAPTAQDYAQVAIDWAEYMPGTIPPNILAINAITGEHWSSRWWAMKAGNAFGMMAWWYQGAWPLPGPPTTPLTPTGDPIPVGAMYFNTTDDAMMVWDGAAWINQSAPNKAATMSMYYSATVGQTVFPLSVPDNAGLTFGFNPKAPEGIHTFVNGVRIEPNYDYTVDIPNSTIHLLRGVPGGAVVGFDVLTPASQLSPAGSANTVLLTQIVPDGTTTTFAGLTVAASGNPVSVARNEELLVSVDGVQQQPGVSYAASGASISFTEAPPADAKIFILWFGPNAATGTGDVTSWNGRGGDVTLLLSDITGIGGAPIASPNFGGTPTAATASPGSSTTQLATTAFVTSALSASGVATFNGRAGAVTLQASDVTGVGGALLASPNLSGTPTAPTPAPGDNSTKIATTAFAAVLAALGLQKASNLSDVASVPTARGNLLAAQSGANGDITALTGLTSVPAIVQQTLRGFIGGLITAWQSNTTILVNSGVALSDDMTTLMTLPSGLTKSLAAWAPGNGGMLDTGVLGNNFYHVFLIENTTSGVVDVLASTSLNSPTMPSGYTKKRRIWTIVTGPSPFNITNYTQIGDQCSWTTWVANYSGTPTGNVPFLCTLLVPPGLSVEAHVSANITYSTGAVGGLYSPYSSQINNMYCPASGYGYLDAWLLSNTTQQIYGVVGTTGTTLNIYTLGWKDTRGRLN
jgi:hypothetical protein